MKISEWKEKNRYSKAYAHFDKKTSLNCVWKYITNPKSIETHGFYPFIGHTQQFKNGEIKVKKEKFIIQLI